MGSNQIKIQKNLFFSKSVSDNIQFVVGSSNDLYDISLINTLEPFNNDVINFFDALSKLLMNREYAKKFPDIYTLGFFLRKANIINLYIKYFKVHHNNESLVTLGKGVVFHIAPSNVPVNFCYSLAVGLLTGNANIVRIPSKNFPQVDIITTCIKHLLSIPEYSIFLRRIFLLKYNKDPFINEYLSSLCDLRVIWGGDNTINEIRKSNLAPRGTEITFADRYSVAFIDCDFFSNFTYEEKESLIQSFYNDTYLNDQNACTSPRAIIWYADNLNQYSAVKHDFYNILHKKVKSEYDIQPVQVVNKLTNAYIAAAISSHVEKIKFYDNYIVSIDVDSLSYNLLEFKENSGYFFNYLCTNTNLLDIREFLNNKKCQTIGYLGSNIKLKKLVQSGIRGVDRIVPIGKTMDFDLIWDGFHLLNEFTRTVFIK